MIHSFQIKTRFNVWIRNFDLVKKIATSQGNIDGGAIRIRTGVQGFAGLCVTTPPWRHRIYKQQIEQAEASIVSFQKI